VAVSGGGRLFRVRHYCCSAVRGSRDRPFVTAAAVASQPSAEIQDRIDAAHPDAASPGAPHGKNPHLNTTAPAGLSLLTRSPRGLRFLLGNDGGPARFAGLGLVPVRGAACPRRQAAGEAAA
jgi:hypothetical protein